MGAVGLLTGPSSAGKTTIGHALRRMTPRPTVFLEGDEMDLPEESEARRWLHSLERQVVVELARRWQDDTVDVFQCQVSHIWLPRH